MEGASRPTASLLRGTSPNWCAEMPARVGASLPWAASSPGMPRAHGAAIAPQGQSRSSLRGNLEVGTPVAAEWLLPVSLLAPVDADRGETRRPVEGCSSIPALPFADPRELPGAQAVDAVADAEAPRSPEPRSTTRPAAAEPLGTGRWSCAAEGHEAVLAAVIWARHPGIRAMGPPRLPVLPSPTGTAADAAWLRQDAFRLEAGMPWAPARPEATSGRAAVLLPDAPSDSLAVPARSVATAHPQRRHPASRRTAHLRSATARAQQTVRAAPFRNRELELELRTGRVAPPRRRDLRTARARNLR